MTDKGHAGRIAKLKETYVKLAHRVQTTIAFLPPRDMRLTQVGLRTGIDMSKSDFGGLCELLIAKGLVTEEEIFESLNRSAIKEVDAYENELSSIYGTNIKAL